jgi:hypothetical protein
MYRLNRLFFALFGVLPLICTLSAQAGGIPSPPKGLRIATEPATDDWEVVFYSGFEEEDLFPKDGSGWTTKREQAPSGGRSSKVETTTEKAHSGAKSLKCFADGADAGNTAKADIYKTNFNLKAGETIRVSAWYWLPKDTFIKTITLMDIECTSSLAEGCDIAKTAGPRIWISHRREDSPPYFSFGRGKLGLPHFKGKQLAIPVGRWFKLAIEMVLGAEVDGQNRLWIDDELDIDSVGTNMMTPDMPKLDHFNFLQFGITANSTGTEPNGQYTPLTIYLDDVLVERHP